MLKPIVFFLFSFFPFHLLAQKAILNGKVSDAESGISLPGANVIVSKTEGTSTNENGLYEISLNPGFYKIRVQFVGYENLIQNIELKANETLTINFPLKASQKLLETVVVSAGKFEQNVENLAVSMEVLKPALIENKNVTSVEQAIEQSPGVIIVDSEPQIRGGSGYSFGAGSRVMVLLDDMPILSGDAGRPTWDYFPFENVEQIEVIKGASSVLHGSGALSGAINIRSAFPKDKPITKIQLTTGIYDNVSKKEAQWWQDKNPIYSSLNFMHARKIKQFDLVIGGNLYSDQGFIGPAPFDTIPGRSFVNNYNNDSSLTVNQTPRGEFEKRARLNVNLRYRFKKISGLSAGVNFNGMYARFANSFIWLNNKDGIYRPYPGTLTTTSQTAYNIDPFVEYIGKKDFSNKLRARFFVLNNDNDNNQANFSTMLFIENQSQKKFNFKTFDLVLTAGLTATINQSNSEIYSGVKGGGTFSNSNNLAFYTQSDWTFFKKLNVSMGMRFERFEIAKDSIKQNISRPVFRSGINYQLFKATFLKASLGQGFRFPTIAETFIRTSSGPLQIYPNFNLKPEYSSAWEFGAKQVLKFGNFKALVDVSYFNQDYQNFIEFTFGQWGTPFVDDFFGLGFRSLNTGKAKISGWETSAAGEFKIEKWTINFLAGYTFTNPVSLDPDVPFETSNNTDITYRSISSDSTSNVLKYRFKHLIRADIELTYGKWMMGWSIRYNSFMENIDRVFIQLDVDVPLLPTGVAQFRAENNKGDYVIDSRLAYQITQESRISLVINNLNNRLYTLRPVKTMPPRTFAIQYLLKF